MTRREFVEELRTEIEKECKRRGCTLRSRQLEAVNDVFAGTIFALAALLERLDDRVEALEDDVEVEDDELDDETPAEKVFS
jgi:dynactin complex subunit